MWIGLLGFVMMVCALVMLVVDLFRRKRKKKSVIIFVVGFVMLVAGVAVDGNSVDTVTNDVEEAEVQETEAALTLEDRIRKSAEIAFGDNLDNVELFDGTDGLKINVFAQVSDNFTNNSIRHGFNGDVVNFLEAVEAEEYNDIFVKGYFDMVDAYGDVENQNIFNMRILKSEVDKINYENFDYDNLENLSETYNWHDTFKE